MAVYKECNAKSKRTGEKCRARAVNGSSKCYHHGGRTPKGIAASNYKTGRYSKYLIPDLAQRYAAALEDTETLDIRHEIALIDVLIGENLSALNTGETAAYWEQSLQQVIAIRHAYQSENYASLEKALNELEALCDQRRLHFSAEKEIREKVDQRRKLVESERKRLIEMEQTITAEQAMLLIGALLDSVRRNVTDKQSLTAIQADFIQYTSLQDSKRLNTISDK